MREEGGRPLRFTRSCAARASRRSTCWPRRLPGLVAGIKFGKTMRWNASNVAFSRPIRWFVSLLGRDGRAVQLCRPDRRHAPRAARAPRARPSWRSRNADAYLPLMAGHQVIVDRAARRQAIVAQVAALAAEVGGAIPDDPGLLDEVTDLVEQPTALRGSFADDYLRLPKEVLITVMKKHQRYFPIVTSAVPAATPARLSACCPTSSPCATARPSTCDVVTRGQRGRDPGSLCRCGLLLPCRHGAAAGGVHAPAGHADLPGEARLDARQGAPRRAVVPALAGQLGLDEAERATAAARGQRSSRATWRRRWWSS